MKKSIRLFESIRTGRLLVVNMLYQEVENEP